MPRSCACCGERTSSGSPSKVAVPASPRCTPVMILISVDLPAPFSPTSAWTSPRATSSDAPRSAGTPPKALSTLSALRSGVVSGIPGTPLVGVRDLLLRVGRVEELVRVDDRGRDLLAGRVLLQGLERLGAEARVALHRGAHLPVDDLLQRVLRAVDGDDDHVLDRLLAGRLQ